MSVRSPSGSLLINSSKWVFSRDFHIAISEYSSRRSRLRRMEPLNTNEVYGMILIELLSLCRPIVWISTPSIVMELPGSNLVILKRAWMMEDFPAPVLPTHPTLSVPWIEKEVPFSTKSKSFLYFILTSLNFIDPFLIQPWTCWVGFLLFLEELRFVSFS